MGSCRNCNMSFDFDRVEPELAGQEFLFLCPRSGGPWRIGAAVTRSVATFKVNWSFSRAPFSGTP